MSDKVSNISKKSGDGTMQSPVMCLEEAIKDFGEDGVLSEYKKVLVLALNDDDQYSVRFLQAGMRMSQCVTLCEVAKTVFLTEMEYIS